MKVAFSKRKWLTQTIPSIDLSGDDIETFLLRGSSRLLCSQGIWQQRLPDTVVHGRSIDRYKEERPNVRVGCRNTRMLIHTVHNSTKLGPTIKLLRLGGRRCYTETWRIWRFAIFCTNVDSRKWLWCLTLTRMTLLPLGKTSALWLLCLMSYGRMILQPITHPNKICMTRCRVDIIGSLSVRIYISSKAIIVFLKLACLPLLYCQES